MFAKTWLKISIPIQFLLLISQALTGLNHDRIPDLTYQYVHVLPGLLLVTLVLVHLAINWDWVRANYFRGKR